jgi:serine/threonine-protein kinase
MGQIDESLQATANADDFERMLLEEFRGAWEQAIGGFPFPDIDLFVSRGGEGDFSDLAKRLEALDREYRNRLLAGNKSKSSENSPPEQNPSLEKTVTGVAPLDTSQPAISWDEQSPPPVAATVDWAPQPDSPYAPTVVGDTAKAGDDPTDDADGNRNGKQTVKQRVAGYEVLSVLGRGGMGVVYRARQVGLNRFVALKMILHGKHAGPNVLSRFRAEAEAVAQLQHPNIVQIYDIGTHEGLPFFSLELVDGPSLAAELGGQPMQPSRAAKLLETLSRAMHYAHVRGIVHRDLKPTNVLLTSKGVPKVTDFGLVKRVEAEDSEQTRTGVIMGTPSYMAPEQAWGSKEVGPLADVYALGATLYCLLTGRPPFVGPSASETILLMRHQEPVAPSKLQPNLPRDLETICLKCLQKEPEKRYANAEELAEDLRRFEAGEPILARPVGRMERLWRWCKRNPALAASAGIAIALAACLMVGGPLAAFLINKEREAAVEAQGEAEANETLAAENAGLARRQGEAALTALDVVVERVNTDLKFLPGTQTFKQKVLLVVMDQINDLIEIGGKDGKDFITAKAYAKMGEVLLEMGQTKAAREQFVRSHAILLELAAADKETAEHIHHLRLGRSFRNLGRAAERLEGAKAVRDLYGESLKARQAALPTADDPLFVKQEIAGSYGDLGRMALELGRPREALDLLTRSIAFREEWLQKAPENEEALREQAGTQSLLGHAHLSLGDTARALAQFQKALPTLNQLAEKNPANISDPVNAALCYNDIGTMHLLSGNPASAKENCDTARLRLEPVFRANSSNSAVVPDLLRKLEKCITAWERPSRN